MSKQARFVLYVVLGWVIFLGAPLVVRALVAE